MKKIVIILFLVIICLIPRVGMLFSTSDYFLHEQGELFLIAKGIVLDHNYPLRSPEVGGLGGFSKGPLFSYFFVPPFILFHGDPFGGRILMFFISVLTVPVIYFCVKRMFGEYAAYTGTFLSCISPFFIVFSGNIFAPYVIPLLTIGYLYAIYNMLIKDKRFFILASFLLGLMMHFEIATAVTLSISFCILFLFFLIKKQLSLKIFLLTLVSFSISQLSLFLYDITHNYENMRGVLALLTYSSKKASVAHTYTIDMLLTNRLDTFSWSFFGTFTPQKIIASAIAIYLLYVGVMYIRDKKIGLNNKIFVGLLLVQPIVSFFFLLLYKGNVFSWWLIELSVVYILLFSIFTTYVWKKKYMKLVSLLLLFLLFTAFISRTMTLFREQVRTSSISYVKQILPLQYIFRDSQDHTFHVEVHTTRASTKDYEYLLWWFGNRNQKKKSNPTYSYIITEKEFPTFKKLIYEAKQNENVTDLGNDFIVQRITPR